MKQSFDSSSIDYAWKSQESLSGITGIWQEHRIPVVPGDQICTSYRTQKYSIFVLEKFSYGNLEKNRPRTKNSLFSKPCEYDGKNIIFRVEKLQQGRIAWFECSEDYCGFDWIVLYSFHYYSSCFYIGHQFKYLTILLAISLYLWITESHYFYLLSIHG